MASPTLSYCAEQVRKFDYDRFLCNLFAPSAEREALSAIYAFNLEIARIREAAREPLLGHMRLRWWADTLDAVYAGRPPQQQVALALADAVHRFGLDRCHLDRIIAARAFDLEDMAPPTLAALVDYADATSASLATAGLQIVGVDQSEAVAAARDVGIAWAMIGLVRAVPFHARARRIYLPADVNREVGLDAFKLFDAGATAGVAAACERVIATALLHLRRAREQRADVPLQALPVLLPATLADYYVDRLRRSGWNPFDTRVQSPSAMRLVTIAIARLRKRY